MSSTSVADLRVCFSREPNSLSAVNLAIQQNFSHVLLTPVVFLKQPAADDFDLYFGDVTESERKNAFSYTFSYCVTYFNFRQLTLFQTLRKLPAVTLWLYFPYSFPIRRLEGFWKEWSSIASPHKIQFLFDDFSDPSASELPVASRHQASNPILSNPLEFKLLKKEVREKAFLMRSWATYGQFHLNIIP